MKFPSSAEVEALRSKYQAGTVVEIVSMDDAQAPPPGTLGEVKGVDDGGSILVNWQTGSTLSLIPDVDSFLIVKEAEQDG